MKKVYKIGQFSNGSHLSEAVEGKEEFVKDDILK
jgi:hypothetical protein